MAATIAEGEIIAGKYRVEKVLGRGGMGVVVAATHLSLGHKVAIKLLLPGATPEIIARFAREARASVRLKCAHVARVLDVGALENGTPYMVMEYLEGKDLSAVLKAQGQLPIAEAVQHVLHACEAIAEAHAAGIIHRDLKPANLLLTEAADGTSTVKVLDFGISKANDPSSAVSGEGMSLTQTAAVLGSPAYMSPEQMKASRDVDARADIWSLGIILYELLAGRPPFMGGSYAELVIFVNASDPEPLAGARGDVPPAVEAAIFRCLEK
ncbi:MAG: serine/threonine-protein kinase, partial [Minicystis sp.]